MTDKQELWELRKQCHELFDKSIKKKKDRKRKYNRLCRRLKVTPEEAHFAKLDKEQLLKALELLKGGDV
jgi:predicted nuclease of restriction endonuclease-like RecB superfamily